MEAIERLPNGIDFYHWTYHCKVPNTNVDFSNFVDAATLFDEIKSNKIKLSDTEKNQTNVKSKLSNNKIGSKTKRQTRE